MEGVLLLVSSYTHLVLIAMRGDGEYKHQLNTIKNRLKERDVYFLINVKRSVPHYP